MLIIHNETLLNFLRRTYRNDDLDCLHSFLEAIGTFHFQRIDNGLFPSADLLGDHASGYQHVWVRDNVHIAHAHYVWGDLTTASHTASLLMSFFQSQRNRMQQVIQDPERAANPMNRPHIRFDGTSMKELVQRWPHAQNDAIGYFLWFFCKLAKEHLVPFAESEQECLDDLVAYLQAIKYWEDMDSGHWEEGRKLSASSIGCVVAGLREFSALRSAYGIDSTLRQRADRIDHKCITELLKKGQDTLVGCQA